MSQKFQIKSLTCPHCGKEPDIYEVTPEEYQRKLNGVQVLQRTFPSLKPHERERLRTGICNECWHRLAARKI